MFRKVNKFEPRGAQVSFLHTMTNVLCHIYEVDAAKCLKHQYKNDESVNLN